MFKYTANTLKKIEAIYEQLGYKIRYERGNFNAGYCLLQDKKIAVINKFFDTEGRINALIEILQDVDVQEDQLEEGTLKFYKQLAESAGTS